MFKVSNSVAMSSCSGHTMAIRQESFTEYKVILGYFIIQVRIVAQMYPTDWVIKMIILIGHQNG
jgi:hypothetical protein